MLKITLKLSGNTDTQPLDADSRYELIVKLTGLPPDAEIVCYCHSGARSALAVLALRSAGFNARNYTGSWHEWSRHAELPLER